VSNSRHPAASEADKLYRTWTALALADDALGMVEAARGHGRDDIIAAAVMIGQDLAIARRDYGMALLGMVGGTSTAGSRYGVPYSTGGALWPADWTRPAGRG
jgi:hypothetical protein